MANDNVEEQRKQAPGSRTQRRVARDLGRKQIAVVQQGERSAWVEAVPPDPQQQGAEQAQRLRIRFVDLSGRIRTCFCVDRSRRNSKSFVRPRSP